MWTCAKCGERIDDQFDSCWKCSTPKSDQSAAVAPAESETAPTGSETLKWRLAHQMFRGTWTTWEELFNEAQSFANEIGTDRVVNISHSANQSDGVVVVWYLTQESENQSAS